MIKSSRVAVILAAAALALEIEGRMTLERRVVQAVDARERAYCSKLAVYLNKSRELMGSPPVDPRNFAEVLESYFQGMAEVMSQGMSNTATGRGVNKTSAKP